MINFIQNAVLDTNIVTLLITLLVPINFLCSFWIFREMLNLSGVLYSELNSEITGNYSAGIRKPAGVFYSSSNRKHNEKSIILAYLLDHSSDAKLTLKLSNLYKASFTPSILSFLITIYITISSNEKKLDYALIYIFILLVVNLAILFCRRFYREKHPLDESLSSILEEKKREYRSNIKTNLHMAFIYVVAGVLITTFIFIGNSVVVGLGEPTKSDTSTNDTQAQIKVPTRTYVDKVIKEYGFETYEKAAQYWYVIDTGLDIVAGEKETTKFEFYELSEFAYTTDDCENFYSQMLEEICKDNSISKKNIETHPLENGGRYSLMLNDNIKRKLFLKGHTIVYAYWYDNADTEQEIQEIFEILLYS